MIYDQLIDIDNGGSGSFQDLTSTSAGNDEFKGVGADDPGDDRRSAAFGRGDGIDVTVNTDSDSSAPPTSRWTLGETVVSTSSPIWPAAQPRPASSDTTTTFRRIRSPALFRRSRAVRSRRWRSPFGRSIRRILRRGGARSGSDGWFLGLAITAVTEVTVQDYLHRNTTTVDVTGFTPGVFTAVAYGISVSVNADGSVTFSGIQEGDHYGFNTGSGDFNAVAVQSELRARVARRRTASTLACSRSAWRTPASRSTFTVPVG